MDLSVDEMIELYRQLPGWDPADNGATVGFGFPVSIPVSYVPDEASEKQTTEGIKLPEILLQDGMDQRLFKLRSSGRKLRVVTVPSLPTEPVSIKFTSDGVKHEISVFDFIKEVVEITSN